MKRVKNRVIDSVTFITKKSLNLLHAIYDIKCHV
jgi:hypothetical protein